MSNVIDCENYQIQESLWYHLSRTSRLFRKYLSQEIIKKDYHVTGEQLDILLRLRQRDGQHQKRLAEELGKDKTTMTRLIKSVEKMNLVKRESNKTDERQKIVYLTNQGEKVIQELTSLVQEVFMNAQQGVNNKSLANCKEVLRKVFETLSSYST
jgi:DNA-binding MarR family transcriptional regulator